ncbi:hypothetical protein FVEG_11903 [Fusarium verticillioides 7600]|uniref:NAD(P)-binding domain-containing protein n=1 Tax=Gibberella moniliformis (strain M3125 / FGSC 7600) TaxID=334819 RepID=W7MPW1_GIBM7|nr:hypothetical protein FVEG_11903 [Fusarium verticillioides 7600]EWG53478.1 hypothetical protein FVEG_11903 [Fusarium verticillioides 7600]
MMHQEKPTIACFGATGGCVATALESALREGFYCTAFVRNPDKLRNVLITQKGIPSDIVDRYLTVHRGDVKDPTAVAQALVSPTNAKFVVDFILSGVGSRPRFDWSITRPLPLQDRTICEDTIKVIYTALSNLSASGITGTISSQKPLLVAVSAAGCGRKRGIPLPVYLPYHYVVGGPLADKKKMENLILEDGGRHVRDFVLMRPLILTDGKAKGDGQLKVGWEWGVVSDEHSVKELGPKIGYLMSKEDLGKWVFDHVIPEGGWEGKSIYLPY